MRLQYIFEKRLKKVDKGTTTVVMDTRQKTQEGLEQVPTRISINLFRATGLVLKWPLQNAHFFFRILSFFRNIVYIYIYIARSLEYSSSSTLAGLSYHICGKLEVAFKGSPSSQHQHCTDEAQKAETVLSAVRYSSLV